jgi:hypothetical protein
VKCDLCGDLETPRSGGAVGGATIGKLLSYISHPGTILADGGKPALRARELHPWRHDEYGDAARDAVTQCQLRSRSLAARAQIQIALR